MKSRVVQMFLSLLLGVSALLSQPAAAQQQQQLGLPDFTSIVAKADPAVVNIRTMSTVPARGGPGTPGDPYDLFRRFFGPDFQPPGGMPKPPGGRPQPRGEAPHSDERTVPRGVGSGFIISSDGYVMTNYHVIDQASDIIVTLTDGRELKAKVIGSDQRTDVAVLKIDATGLATLPIGDSHQLKKGQWVLAIGSPFGLDSTVTAGIISAINRDTGEYLPFIQTDVAVNPGNSGGPLINLQGEVIGINSQIISRSGGFMGISLAIPIDEAMAVADQLKANGKVTRGRIAVQIGEVSKEVADAIGLSKAEGALVSRVEPNGPADKAGVKPGDVITSFNGENIKRWSDLPRIVGQTKPGTKAPLEVWRKGKTVKLTVTVEEIVPEKTASADGDKGDQPETVAGKNPLGVAVADLSADEKQQLHIAGGVEIKALADDGAADRAGLQEGDIILSINDSDIANVAEFNKVVAKLDKAKTAALLVRRDDQAQWVAVPLK